MKCLSFLLFVLLSLHCTTLVEAQSVPNGSFENWVIGGGPDLWYTNNLYWPPIECILIYADFQAYSGNICAKGVADSCVELSILYPPILTSFDIDLNTKPEALHGFYKYFPIDQDLFSANVKLYKDSVLIGEGSLKSKQAVTDFTEFIVNIDYLTNDNSDIAVIEFTIDSSQIDKQLHQGSMWYIDSVFFGPVTYVSKDEIIFPQKYYLHQNYPNPFNPITKIKYEIPLSPPLLKGESEAGGFVNLKVYDVLGNEITTLVNEEKPAGIYEVEFDGVNLSNGVYFYQLTAGSFVETKKMVLLK